MGQVETWPFFVAGELLDFRGNGESPCRKQIHRNIF
jgi:hypothetical protein